MPLLVVVLLGGFVVNAVWCLMQNARNKTLGGLRATRRRRSSRTSFSRVSPG
jgi:hypothetical protein